MGSICNCAKYTGAIKALMILETNRKKTTIWVSALTFGIITVIFMGFYLARLDSVNKM